MANITDLLLICLRSGIINSNHLLGETNHLIVSAKKNTFQAMPYSLFDQRHNFAAWAAARAVQRGWKGANVQNIKAALESSCIHRYLPDPAFMDVNCVRFEELHKLWCKEIVASLYSRNIANATYGRAAKIIAIYL